MTATSPVSTSLATVKLEDFGVLQSRYQAMELAGRAAAMLEDAKAAMDMAERIITDIEKRPVTQLAFDSLRGNVQITGKMRASEAKNLLMDKNSNYLQATRNKLASWRKTLERIAGGEGITRKGQKEVIETSAPIALALTSSTAASGFLSMIQLALGEMAKLDVKHADEYKQAQVEMRRCATLISDCDTASGLSATIH